MKPKVSIVMPVLNGERYIAEAIRSILAQTYDNYELIVVDDGSTDATREVVHSFLGKLTLKYHHRPVPQGIAPSMTDGVIHSSGELISFLDHDDAWFPTFLETQVAYLQKYPDVAMVHSDFQTIDSDGNVIEQSVAASRRRVRPSGYVFPQLFLDSFIVGNSVMIRRECFDRLGMFDQSLRWGDYHMWMRIARYYKVDYVPKVLTQYRQHSTQSTRSTPVQWINQEPVGIQAIKKILEQYPEIRQELGERVVRGRMAGMYFDMAYIWFLKGGLSNARDCLAKAIHLSPCDARYYVLYAASLLRPSHAMALRAGWRWLRAGANGGYKS
jgi:glycosyltransferase involved in cell wall biosynthesis